LTALSAAGGLAASVATTPGSHVADWPQLVLVYQERGHANGLSGAETTQTWRLTYDNQRAWTKQLLADPEYPDIVSQTIRFADGVYSIDDPVTGNTIVPPGPAPGLVVPDWWLVPRRDRDLERRGYTKLVEPDAPLTRYIASATVPCAPDTDGQTIGVSQPASCATETTYTTRETVTYRTDVDPPIPIEVSDEMNGVVVSNIVVTHLVVVEQGRSVTLIS
jgi:hypothetical protein